MELSDQNPSPFKQPFLILAVNPTGRRRQDWLVDVNADVKKYIDKKKPTLLLQTVCNHLAAHGYFVEKFGTYEGSGGPSHVLRNGAFFRRMNEQLEEEEVEEPTVSSPSFQEF